jgi:hypothetical protein
MQTILMNVRIPQRLYFLPKYHSDHQDALRAAKVASSLAPNVFPILHGFTDPVDLKVSLGNVGSSPISWKTWLMKAFDRPQNNHSRQRHPQSPKKVTYSIGGATSTFGFFSNTWILGCSNSKPSAVTLPIWPPIAATHIGKLACASVNFFQTLGLTDTETIRPSQSSSKDCQPFWSVLASGSALILMVSSSFPVVGIGISEVVGDFGLGGFWWLLLRG